MQGTVAKGTTIGNLYKNKDTRGDITVKKSFNVPFTDLYIEEGFNVKGKIYDEVVQGLEESYIRGDYVPPIVVQAMSDGSCKVVDGHHRHKAIENIIARGYDFKRVTVEGFNGTMSQQVALMVTSSQGRNLNPVERAEAYRRLESYGLTKDEIATTFTVSPASVTHHLSISELTPVVKDYISEGKIAADFALEINRKSGEQGVIDVVEGSLTKGAKKATRKNTSAWRPAMGKSVVTLLSSVESYDDGEGVTALFSHEDWATVQEAIKAIGEKK